MAGCATPSGELNSSLVELEKQRQLKLVFDDYWDKQLRLETVYYPLKRDSAALCGSNISPYYGTRQLWSRSLSVAIYSLDWVKYVARRFDLGKVLKIVKVIPNSPADRAGLLVGDSIVSVNNKPLPSGRKSVVILESDLRSYGYDGKPVILGISRGNETTEIIMKADMVCNYNAVLVSGTDTNANTDKNGIYVDTAMMAFAQSDQDLALVLSHELSHNIKRHIGSSRNSKYMEKEADYLSLYIMARSGYSIEGVAKFWRRMSLINPSSIWAVPGSTHPSNPERFVFIEKVVDEIQQKIAAGEPLIPD